MLHFFIDTNILLSFYSFTQDDLTRLEELAARVEAGRFVILTTSHVEDEFRRNREAKIAESLKDIKTKRLDIKLPRLCDPYPQTDEMRQLAGSYSQLHAQLMEQIDEDTEARTLRADSLIARFFDGAERLEITPAIVDRARLRVELGNPPGKRGSIGDAVNWEALLEQRPRDRLFFVTDDVDFYSPLVRARPHEFLTAEWEGRVGEPITFVRRLAELPEPVPHDVLPLDDAPDERDELVTALLNSGNFARTHRVIGDLQRVESFTPRQARDLVAALENSQVGWILHDEDVHDFYSWLDESHGRVLPDDDLARLRYLLRDEPVNAAEGDVPF